jgi:hypothetical protein
VTSLDALVRHIRDNASVEQLIAMTELRVIFGPAELRSRIDSAVWGLLTSDAAVSVLVAHVRAQIGELEALGTAGAASELSLGARIRKTLDETVRALQVRHAMEDSEGLTPSVTKALGVLAQHKFVDADTARDALDVRHRLRQIETMRSVRFGRDRLDSLAPVRVDPELLLAAGMIDIAEWRAVLAEGVLLLCAIRDAYLR